MTTGHKLRVYSELIEHRRYWWYEVYNPSRPAGVQMVRTGVRPTWTEALHAGLSYRGAS